MYHLFKKNSIKPTNKYYISILINEKLNNISLYKIS